MKLIRLAIQPEQLVRIKFWAIANRVILFVAIAVLCCFQTALCVAQDQMIVENLVRS